jgi:hypothetical protein
MKKTRQQVLDAEASTTGTPIDEDVAEIDRRFEEALRAARSRPPAPMVTEKSVCEGEAFMAEFRKGSAEALARRIERKELLTAEELLGRLGGDRRWLSAALESGRLFAVQAPSGADFFPAFFADDSLDRRALGKVTKVLSGLPGASQYQFFVSKFFTLGMTPLEALAEGRVRDVLTTAAGFAER